MMKDMAQVQNLPSEEVAQLEVGKVIIVNPKTVGWYVQPIRKNEMMLRVTYIEEPNMVPHRHAEKYGDAIELHMKGVVIDGEEGFKGREYEFWTIRGVSSLVPLGHMELVAT